MEALDDSCVASERSAPTGKQTHRECVRCAFIGAFLRTGPWREIYPGWGQ